MLFIEIGRPEASIYRVVQRRVPPLRLVAKVNEPMITRGTKLCVSSEVATVKHLRFQQVNIISNRQEVRGGKASAGGINAIRAARGPVLQSMIAGIAILGISKIGIHLGRIERAILMSVALGTG